MHKKSNSKPESETQAAKNEHRRQLEELARLTGELAHEIKNPLSTIKVNLKLIGEELESPTACSGQGIDDQTRTRALRKIAVVQKEADRLQQILNDFLRFADMSELQLASVDVNELVSDMVDFYSPQAHSNSIIIRQGLHPQPLVCKIDADMLKQVILNLFINAQQAIGDNGELIIRTSIEEEQAVIQISDTGSGIAEDKLSNIFNAFYSSRPQGSGLGLPTAKKIIDAHNGSLTVSSELGKGTSFAIKLRLKVFD